MKKKLTKKQLKKIREEMEEKVLKKKIIEKCTQ